MLDVVPGGSLPGGIPQERGGVVRHDQGYSVVAVHSTTEFADRQLRLQKRLGGECSEGQNDLGADQLDLADQIWTAGCHLVRQRVTITRRAVFEDVADENVFALQVDGSQNLGQELTGSSHERVAGQILLLAWRFTNAYELRLRATIAWNAVRGGRPQRAPFATRRVRGYGFQAFQLRERTTEQIGSGLSHR